jgi:hypothetical protein
MKYKTRAEYRAQAETATQVRKPWRATLRTLFAMVVAFAAMWPAIIEAAGLGSEEWITSSILVAGAITRVMALPAVESFLAHFFPWLAADPGTSQRQKMRDRLEG